MAKRLSGSTAAIKEPAERSGRLIRLFYILFTVCFAFAWVSVMLRGRRGVPGVILLMLGTAACAALLCLTDRLLGRFEQRLEHHYDKILAAFSAGMFLLELALALLLRHGTWFDAAALHQGAAEWVETGTFEGFYEYYGYFPNNLGGMTFLYVFFKAASLLGITDLYAVASFVTCVMVVGMMAVVSLTCKKLAGAKSAVLALAVFALSVQFCFLGGAVYTDTLSMLFPILTFYLYLLSKKARGGKKLLLYLLMGLAAGVGSLIKFTVLIMAVAVLLDLCLNRKWKDLLKAAVCMIGIAAAMNLALSAYMYSAHLSREEAEANNTPLLHWVMMGLKGSGYYNGEDYAFTRSLDPEGRNGVLLEEIGSRIRERGVTGMLDLISKKSAVDFGDGTYGADDFLKIPPTRESWLHRFVLRDGAFYGLYSGYTTALHCALLLLLAACPVKTGKIWKRGGGGRITCLPYMPPYSACGCS